MFLLEPARTPFDLNFRIFHIPVRVHPMFWIISALFGWSLIRQGLGFVLLWVGCTFVSILVHELGHVLVGQLFGRPGHIILYSFGGLAVGSNREPYRWQRIAVSFAGPLAGFLLLAAVWAVAAFGLPRFDPERKLLVVRAALGMLFVQNLFWNVLNLLPVWPLDGGQISREVCEGVSPYGGLRFSLGISLLVAGVLAVHALMTHNGRPLIPYLDFLGDMYMALFFAMLALQSFQMLQQAPVSPRPTYYDHEDEDDQVPWERGPYR